MHKKRRHIIMRPRLRVNFPLKWFVRHSSTRHLNTWRWATLVPSALHVTSCVSSCFPWNFVAAATARDHARLRIVGPPSSHRSSTPTFTPKIASTAHRTRAFAVRTFRCWLAIFSLPASCIFSSPCGPPKHGASASRTCFVCLSPKYATYPMSCCAPPKERK